MQKSSQGDLRKRGFVTDEDIAKLADISQKQLLEMLHAADAVTRSAAACHLIPTDDISARALLKQLAVERCLYTRISICERLEKGDLSTAAQMTAYLGKIGNNQHKTLPNKASEKKSFPLPRDIIARSLGKMSTDVFPALQMVVTGSDLGKISEVLDAIGFMVFYNSELATPENIAPIVSLLKTKGDSILITWKTLLCLSAFPLPESERALRMYIAGPDVIGMEARRSLSFLERSENTA